MIKRLDVIGLGTNAIEQVVTLQQLPTFGGSSVICPSHLYQVSEGGTIGNALTGLARLGLKIGYIGKLSGDHFGMLLTKSCINEGIDLTHCDIVPSGQAAQYWIVSDRDNQRIQLFFPNILAQIDESYITTQSSYIKSCRVLIIEASGIPLTACVLATEIAKAEGIVVILNLNISKTELLHTLQSGTEQELETLITFSDFLILPRHIAQDFSHHNDPKKCAEALRAKYLIPAVVLHHYRDGCVVATEEEEMFHVPSFGGEAPDSYGFNDAFLAGLTFGIYSDWAMYDAVKFANAYGAVNSLKPGIRTGMGNKTEIEQFLATHP